MHYDKIFINGEWVEPDSSEIIQVENPADKSIVGSVPASNSKDVDRAVKAAKAALESWKFTPLQERIQYVEKLIKELRNRKDDLTDTIVKELGAPRDFAKGVQLSPYLRDMENFIQVVKEYPLEEEYDGYNVVKEAVGVVAALTPWNYPFGQITKKLAPALLSGSTLVLKPSQKTPLVSYILAEAIEAIGLPKGVFNLVPGRGSDVGNPLTQHEDVNLVTFTGSTKGGRQVGKLAIDHVKRITLELGGKSPALVLKGADLDLVVSKVLTSIYLNTGQSCSALSRLVVPAEEKENIEKLIVEKSKTFNFGDPEDPKTHVGPLSSKKQFDKVKGFLEKGLDEGAKMLVGQIPQESHGYFVGPVVFTSVKNSMEIAQEEIFGPVLCLITYNTLEEGIQIANDTKYGLAARVFGPEDQALDVAKKIKAGQVSINDFSSGKGAPFGGFKHSGIGREGGKYGLEEFLEIKTIFKD